MCSGHRGPGLKPDAALELVFPSEVRGVEADLPVGVHLLLTQDD